MEDKSQIETTRTEENKPEIVVNDYGATKDSAVVVEEADRTVLLTENETIVIEKEPGIDVGPEKPAAQSLCRNVGTGRNRHGRTGDAGDFDDLLFCIFSRAARAKGARHKPGQARRVSKRLDDGAFEIRLRSRRPKTRVAEAC